jgi:recombination associated protein RdgC
MWFKNLCVYRLAEPFAWSAEGLADKLAEFGFQPVARTETVSRGWVPPLGRGAESLVHSSGGRIMICLQEEQRLLPPTVVRETLDERVAEREESEARKLGRREKARMKDEITLELLPRAFTRSRRSYAYIDTREGFVVVDSGTWRAAEELTELLRESLGSLPLRPLQTVSNPQRVMTEWLGQDDTPGDIELGDEAVLEDPDNEGAEVRVKRQDLQSAEIQGHIRAGKHVRRLAVTWNERMQCVIDTDLSVKRLKFLDSVQDEAGDREAETDAERFDADFTIMTLELGRFLPRLLAWFDGESGTEGSTSASAETGSAAS